MKISMPKLVQFSPYAGLPGLLVVRYFVIVEIAYCDADSGMFNFMST